MSELKEELREAFETDGYEVAAVSQNRDQYRIELLEEGADATAVRETIVEAVGEDSVLGFDVSTESPDGAENLRTVVTFRHRG